jgi:hypothetical protein
MYQNATIKTTGGLTSIHRITWCNITSAWNESTTWNTQPSWSCPYPVYLFPIPYSSDASYPPYHYYLSDLGSYGRERTGMMTDYVNASIDNGYVDIGLLQSSGCYNWSIQSRETPNTAMRPRLEINYNPSATEGSILNVGFPSNAKVNEVKPITVTIRNTGNTTSAYIIGYSIGNFESPYTWCNSNPSQSCYQSWTEYGGSRWFAVDNITAGGAETYSIQYKFLSSFFAVGSSYDVWVRVLDENLTTIDEAKYNNVVSITGIGGLVSGEITHVSYPNETLLNEVKDIGVTVKNTGIHTGTFVIGLSIGRMNEGWCNHNCYSGGVSINGSLYFGELDISSGQSETATTGFQFKDNFFVANRSYDIWITLRDTNLDVIDELFVYNATTVMSPVIPNVMVIATGGMASFLGISVEFATNLIAIIASIVAGGYVGYKSKAGMLGAVTMLAMIIVFTMIGWLPIWIVIILGVVTALLVTRWVSENVAGRI